MRKFMLSLLAIFALCGSVLIAHVSNAEQASPTPVLEQSSMDISGFGPALSSDNLGSLSGRQALQIEKLDTIVSNVSMNGNLNDNSISVGDNSQSLTGNNSIAGEAFKDMNGFATVIQNSGNQVLIQNDLIVNVLVN
ncbi:MAG: hypothetical protein EHM79_06515 [Geobacter sp.]|nr:MAG: hypothetical protein EHM79_06515 [Geobacter sp.]